MLAKSQIGNESPKVIFVFNQDKFHIAFVSGTCECDEGFGAKDCSMDLNKPPVVYGVNIEEGGLCDKRTCQRALVEGYGFLNMDTLQCSLTVFQVKHTQYSFEPKQKFHFEIFPNKKRKVEQNTNKLDLTFPCKGCYRVEKHC